MAEEEYVQHIPNLLNCIVLSYFYHIEILFNINF